MVDACDDDGAVPTDTVAEALALTLADAASARRRPEVARIEDGDGAKQREEVRFLMPRQVRDGRGELIMCGCRDSRRVEHLLIRHLLNLSRSDAHGGDEGDGIVDGVVGQVEHAHPRSSSSGPASANISVGIRYSCPIEAILMTRKLLIQ